MAKMWTLVLLGLLPLLASQVTPSEGANILFFIGFGSPSHRLAMEPMIQALSAKGHNVTVLSKDTVKDTNSKVHYFTPEKLTQYFANSRASGNLNLYDMRASGMFYFSWLITPSFGLQVCEQLYTDPTFVNWVKSTKFDLIIVDSLFNECGYGLGHVHKAKVIVFSVSTVLSWIIEGSGVPDESSVIPDLMLPFPHDMSFFHRLVTAVMPVGWKLFRKFHYFPALRRITQEGLGLAEFPDFDELERNTSLYLVNTYATQEFPRALPPNVIPVGGISWIEKRKPIPQKMEDFINKGKDGFVYVSFGSFIDFSTFSASTQQTFINALKRFPNIQFIWKLNEIPKDLPENFFVDKWLPQQDLLLHPKIRAFITHSGIGGVNEAIYSSVPLICFPIFAEQDHNAQHVERKGVGIRMEITSLTEADMVNAIRRILEDDTYRKNMKKMTDEFLDRPVKPLDAALWWTEYVLRHDNTDSLRPLNVRQSWWVKRQLDVWLFLFAFVLASIVISTIVSCKILKCLKRRVSGVDSSSPKKGKKQKKN